MPSIEEKAIFKQVNYIKNKFTRVKQETESVVSLLHSCLNIFDHRIEQLEECGVENFTTLYRKLNNDFESFQEKLIYIEAYIELPPDCEIVSKKLSTECENEIHNRKETKSSPFHSISEPAALETPSSSQASPTENVTSSIHLEKVASSDQLKNITPSDQLENVTSSIQLENVASSVKLENVADCVSSSKLISYPSVNDLEKVATGFTIATLCENDKIKSTENVTSAIPNETSVENKINTYSSNSTSYASVNDVEDSVVIFMPQATEIGATDLQGNIASHRSVDACKSGHFSSHIASAESLSQISDHHSVSSNLSDYQSASSGQGNTMRNFQNAPFIRNESENYGSQTFPKRREISSIQIDCPMTTTATVTHIENPGNFWMRLDNFESSRLCFPMKMFLKSDVPTAVKVGDYFLSPSKSVPVYLRVKVITADANDDHVKVFFIDNGLTQNVPLKELRVLPYEAYEIPMRAINCTLADICARNGIWCFAAIQKFRDCSAGSLEANIKYLIDDKYAVQLVDTVCDFTCDIGQSLCIDGFATENYTHLQISSRKSAPDLCDSNTNSMQTSNQLSSDSGVSVTFNQPSTPTTETPRYSSSALDSRATKDVSKFQKELQEMCNEKLVFEDSKPKTETENAVDLISFESMERLENEILTVSEPDIIFTGFNRCLKIGTCKCPLHFLIPFPSINFVEQDMVLVMLSHIAHPNEFYVHMAMENSITLDEHLEQMFNVYNPPSAQDTYSILLDDLKVGMFCVAYFSDGCWYRVKVLDIRQTFDQSHNVFVQYIDYGNKAWVKNTDLRTLTREFAEHPAFSVKCSLAGIVPTRPADCYKDDTGFWNEEAVNVFKSLVSFENCLTAQICDRTSILNDDPLQILLWDTQGEIDVLLNKIFVESKLASYDYAAIEHLYNQLSKKKPDVEILNRWNPMLEEYNDVQNSYGVNFDDFQVATDGYKHRDEEYICKYFSLRGYCPRKVCPYQHVHLAEGGVTRDQDELYSFNCHPPLPRDGSFILIQVSAVKSPSFFYAQLPFGNLTVDELDSQIKQGIPRESLYNREMIELYDALNKHYTDKPFDEATTIGLSYGSIVVARRLYDQTWHRARIIDVQDITGPAKVFYVDFGNEDWVDRRNIRQISPEFLHAPFQAIECCLYDVEPLGFEKGLKWSSYAVSCFKDLVSETIMLAHVAYKFNDALQISLRRTTQNDHMTIKEHLIRQGFGQEKLLVVTKKRTSKYMPG